MLLSVPRHRRRPLLDPSSPSLLQATNPISFTMAAKGKGRSIGLAAGLAGCLRRKGGDRQSLDQKEEEGDRIFVQEG